jgi:hypothetical protein
MEWFVIYLFVMIEKLSALLAAGYSVAAWGIAGLFATFVVCGFMVVVHEDSAKFAPAWQHGITRKARKWFILMTCFGFFFGILGSIMPNHKQLAIIAGSGLTYQALTSEQGKRMGGKAVDLLEKQIDDALKDENPISIPPAVKEKAKEVIKEATKEPAKEAPKTDEGVKA